MAPAASTIPSSKSNLSSNTDKATSLSNYKELDFSDDLLEAYQDCDWKNSKLWLITVPDGFPTSHLQKVPLASDGTFPIKVPGSHDPLSVQSYICESKVQNSPSCALIPSNSEDSFCCKRIDGTVHVRKSAHMNPANTSNCLQRPAPPRMSDGLKERLKLFGWQSPGGRSESSDDTASAKHGKKRKKEKGEKKSNKKAKKHKTKH